MKAGEKVVVGTLGVLGTGLAIYGISRVRAEAPPEGEGAEIGIVILGPDGQPVPKNSPVTLLEGESYVAQVTVVNATTKGGVAWEAFFRVVAVGVGAMFYIYPSISREEYFAAGETRVFEYSFNVPMGYGGQSGEILAQVLDPAGTKIASASEPVTIETVAIIYGADIVIGV
ncbi:hypothetical protein ES703_27108 [subsurface metagenome]